MGGWTCENIWCNVAMQEERVKRSNRSCAHRYNSSSFGAVLHISDEVLNVFLSKRVADDGHCVLRVLYISSILPNRFISRVVQAVICGDWEHGVRRGSSNCEDIQNPLLWAITRYGSGAFGGHCEVYHS